MKYESLQYIDICRQEINCDHQFYFDAFDIIWILQGVNRFYQGANNKFDSKLFDQDSSIVHALAFGKFLKANIKLLPTHQAELIRVIKDANNGKEYIFYRKDDNKLRRFLENDLRFFEKLKDMTTQRDPAEINNNDVKSWIDEKAKDFFKAIFISYKANFKERLQELFGNEIVKVENYDINDIRIHDDDLFIALSEVFRQNRPNKEIGGSNFSDVAALMFLARAVKDYNDDNSNPLPVYFDSHNYKSFIPEYVLDRYFRLVQKDADDGESVYSYALRDHDYFRLYALVNSNSMYPVNEDLRYADLVKSGELSQQLKETIAEPSLFQRMPQVIAWYNKGNEDLKERIIEYIEVDFFKTMVIALKKDRLDIINNILITFDKDELNPESADVINEQSEQYLAYINHEINDILRETVSMFNTIQTRIKNVLKVLEKLKELNQELDIFHDYSLFRFMIPRRYQNSLKHFFSEDGLLSNNGIMANFSRVTLWTLYYRTVYYKHNKGTVRNKLLDINELYLLYGSFWILNLHDKLIDFNSKVEYLRPLDHSLLMLIAASVNRAISEFTHDKAKVAKYKKVYLSIIQTLEERLADEKLEKDDLGQIKIVLAYLYFHLWLQKGNILNVMKVPGEEESVEYSPETDNFKAISYAKAAFEYFKTDKDKNATYYLYSFNIYVYFVIDTAPKEEFIKIGSLRSEFINLKGKTKDWHFRYDDTIARNFHRLSILVSGKDKKLPYLEKAIKILEECIKKHQALEGRDINEVRAYSNTLVNIMGELDLMSANTAGV